MSSPLPLKRNVGLLVLSVLDSIVQIKESTAHNFFFFPSSSSLSLSPTHSRTFVPVSALTRTVWLYNR